MISKIKKMVFPKRYKIQTFTYYIPAPSSRESGYREKQFDKAFYSFINQGFEILSINTTSNTGPNGSGMWFVATVRGEVPLALDDKIRNISVDEIQLEDLESPNQ